MSDIQKKLKLAIEQLKVNYSRETREELLDILTEANLSDTRRNFVLVYGSLRRDQYNYKKVRANFGLDSFIHIGTVELAHNKMFSLGQYPAVLGAGYQDKIVVEIMYCSIEAKEFINDMEEGAGYRQIQTSFRYKTTKDVYGTITAEYYIAGRTLYDYITDFPEKFPRVVSGDWVRYCRSVEKEIV